MAVTYFQLPQRLMLVNGFSSFEAAIRTVPFGAASAAGNVLSGLLSSKLKIPSIYIILLGSTLQVIGFALLGTLRETQTIEKKVFGYQVIAGMGCTLSFATALILTAFTAEPRDRGKYWSSLETVHRLTNVSSGSDGRSKSISCHGSRNWLSSCYICLQRLRWLQDRAAWFGRPKCHSTVVDAHGNYACAAE